MFPLRRPMARKTITPQASNISHPPSVALGIDSNISGERGRSLVEEPIILEESSSLIEDSSNIKKSLIKIPMKGVINKTGNPVSPQKSISNPGFVVPTRSMANAPRHVIVDALAGTGKTFTIVQAVKMLYGMDDQNIVGSPEQDAIWREVAKGGQPGRTCFLAFNNTIKDELEKRLKDVCKHHPVTIMTCHGFGKQLLVKAGYRHTLDKYKVGLITTNLMGFESWQALDSTYSGFRLLLSNVVRMIKMNLLDPTLTTIMELINHYDMSLPTDEKTREQYIDMLEVYVDQVLVECAKNTAIIDFDDMIWLPTKLGISGNPYDLMFVDERQDLSAAQQQLICGNAKRLVVVGDENQAIYGFAGADIKACTRLTDRLHGSTLGCVSLPLTVTRRCPKAVVREAQKIVPSLQALEDAPEGIVGNRIGDDFLKEVEHGDMILCRTNAPLVIYALHFLRKGRKVHIAGQSIAEKMIDTLEDLSDWANAIPSSRMDTLTELAYATENKVQLMVAKRAQSTAIVTVQDEADALAEFISRTNSKSDCIKTIKSLFCDDKDIDGIYLSSVHRAKGLERRRVWIVRAELMPHPKCTQLWMLQQEQCLKYVAITRAMDELYFVYSPKKEKEQEV